MNYIDADTMEWHTGSVPIIIKNPPLTYDELKRKCELLEAQAVIQNRAMGDMSKEVCELSNEISRILDELQNMQ